MNTLRKFYGVYFVIVLSCKKEKLTEEEKEEEFFHLNKSTNKNTDCKSALTGKVFQFVIFCIPRNAPYITIIYVLLEKLFFLSQPNYFVDQHYLIGFLFV